MRRKEYSWSFRCWNTLSLAPKSVSNFNFLDTVTSESCITLMRAPRYRLLTAPVDTASCFFITASRLDVALMDLHHYRCFSRYFDSFSLNKKWIEDISSRSQVFFCINLIIWCQYAQMEFFCVLKPRSHIQHGRLPGSTINHNFKHWCFFLFYIPPCLHTVFSFFQWWVKCTWLMNVRSRPCTSVMNRMWDQCDVPVLSAECEIQAIYQYYQQNVRSRRCASIISRVWDQGDVPVLSVECEIKATYQYCQQNVRSRQYTSIISWMCDQGDILVLSAKYEIKAIY
jgi:hypothetical protein